MPASIRARTPLRATLNVETLEGRAIPAAGFAAPTIAGPRLAAPPTDTNALQVPVGAPGQSAVRVVSQIFVNGELVMKLKGKPQFAAIGPALSGDENGNHVESGGTTVFANGTVAGTFDGSPTITRNNPIYVQNKHGQTVKVVNYHINGVPYLAPPEQGISWLAASGAYVG